MSLRPLTMMTAMLSMGLTSTAFAQGHRRSDPTGPRRFGPQTASHRSATPATYGQSPRGGRGGGRKFHQRHPYPRHGSPRRMWVRPRYEIRERQIVIPATYETVYEQMWVEPVYECQTRQVWVPRHDHNRLHVRVGDFSFGVGVDRHRERGRYETVTEQVLVQPGYYTTVQRQVVIRPQRIKVVREEVLVREGYWRRASHR